MTLREDLRSRIEDLCNDIDYCLKETNGSCSNCRYNYLDMSDKKYCANADMILSRANQLLREVLIYGMANN